MANIKIQKNIESKIYTIRDVNIMLDKDLAKLYQVETRRINEQVKRNIERFPNDFMFQLTKDEFENLMSQNAISSSEWGGVRKLPYVFSEQGVWEKIHNPDFNYGEYATITSKAGLNNHKLSVKEWTSETNTIGLIAKTGRYGGTYA